MDLARLIEFKTFRAAVHHRLKRMPAEKRAYVLSTERRQNQQGMVRKWYVCISGVREA